VTRADRWFAAVSVVLGVSAWAALGAQIAHGATTLRAGDVDADAFSAGFVLAEQIAFGTFVALLGWALFRKAYRIVTGV